eukprot:TRINITY_DN66831_c7_g1_i1.p3 TRINITY_DN66831_c7_g1~~TRINITY_DN66831_c7_g1_i1.p3  ORF type:complete len:215 (-),score=143.68 TRINITY_DN66831_c7_g1_i1:951-1595(-)
MGDPIVLRQLKALRTEMQSVATLAAKVRQLEHACHEKDVEIKQIKASVKHTSLRELQVEADTYYKEARRMRKVVLKQRQQVAEQEEQIKQLSKQLKANQRRQAKQPKPTVKPLDADDDNNGNGNGNGNEQDPDGYGDDDDFDDDEDDGGGGDAADRKDNGPSRSSPTKKGSGGGAGGARRRRRPKKRIDKLQQEVHVLRLENQRYKQQLQQRRQ